MSFYLVLILFALITMASYTWFTISKTPRVSDMNLYVNASPKMELSLDPLAQEWTLQLNLQDMMPESTPLRPVTWVEEQQSFYAATYNTLGRLQDFSEWEKLSDDKNANKTDQDGYYIKLTFYARSDSAVKVTLSPAVEVEEGVHGSGTYLIGVPEWNDEVLAHENAGLGAEMAMRIGIRVTEVDANGTNSGNSVFYIYEPNADSHIDGSTGYVKTPSATDAADLTDTALLIRQSASSWVDSDPVEQGVVIKNLGEFMDSPTLFTLQANEMVRLDVYIWLEGQDIDCISAIDEAKIMACLQFDADPVGGSGLQPIK